MNIMGVQTGILSFGVGKTCTHFYLCNYCPRETGPDRLSESLLRFKSGLPPDRETWISCSREMLGEIFQEEHAPFLLIRALHHDEQLLTGDERTSLDLLAQTIAGQVNGAYFPRMIGKRKRTRKFITIHKKDLRTAELNNVYYVCEPYRGPTPKTLLLVDDIVTTGVTVSSILQTVMPGMPGVRPFVFSLAKASPDHSLNRRLFLREGWQAREDPAFYGPSEPPVMTVEQLKDLIIGDAF